MIESFKKIKNYNCHSNHSIFLRSNGSIACWCDSGRNNFLQLFDPEINYATQVYLGNVFESIREKLRHGLIPFSDFCKSCLSLNINSFDEQYAKNMIINTFQIEPSIACNLSCLKCPSTEKRMTILPKTAYGHIFLNPIVLEKIITDFSHHKITIKNIEFQGHGEPLLNNNTWSMIKLAKSFYNSSSLEIVTNANFLFENYMIESGIDKITFSIDGVDEPTYIPYRKNGSFTKSFKFMKDFCNATSIYNKNIYRIWKYVVFDHNDTDSNLLKVQKLALDLNIDEIHFVLTRMGPASQKIINFDQIPILSKDIKISHNYFGVHYSILSKYYNQIIFDFENNNIVGAINNSNIFSSLVNRLYKHCSTDLPKEFKSLIDSFEKNFRRFIH